MNESKTGPKLSREAVIASGQAQKERKYWLEQLAGEWERAQFIYDKTGTASTERTMEKEKFTFTGDLFARMVKMSGSVDPTLHMILVAGVTFLIGKYTGSRDIVAATSIDKQEIQGEFVNTLLPLRVLLENHITFKQLLIQVKDTISGAVENQNYPIEVLMYDDLGVSSADGSLLDVAILLENIQDPDYIRHINFSMIFSFLRTGEVIEGVIEYNSALYHKTTIQRIIKHLESLFRQALFNVDLMLPQVDILSGEEREQLLTGFNDSTAAPPDKTFQQLFEEQVERIPDKPVVKFLDRELTYRELNENANRLARYLRRSGIEKDQPVGILLNRSPQLMVSILAVWKVGAAYIPLDTQYPSQRHNDILADAGTRVLITLSQFADNEKTKDVNGPVILLDSETEKIAAEDRQNIDTSANINSLAYVIYTSGSTGKPKGAMVEQIGMMNHIWAKIRDLDMTENSVVAQNAPSTFDISVWQFLAALVTGGETVIYPGMVVLDPEQFILGVKEDRITILEVVPSYLSVLLDALDANHREFESLKYLLVTGETVKPGLVKRWFDKYPGVKMVNAYGPTEASDDITHYIMDKPVEMERVPIGSPLRNFQIIIVDKNMKLCPIGVKGEICVSGPGVGRGYLNRPELTAETFLPVSLKFHRSYMSHMSHDSYMSHKSLYQTGDLGRWLPDGNIEFFGRKDYQVKIRGFRIELGEIESKLAAYPGIKDAVVIDREDERGDRYLCGYLVKTAGSSSDISAIRGYLLDRLSDYMVPAYFVELGEIPLTPNGKVDRKSLPEPDRDEVETIIFISASELKKIGAKKNITCKEVTEDFWKESQQDTYTIHREEKLVIEEYSRQRGIQYYPLSHSQKMVYYIEKTYPGTSIENDGDIVKYQGEFLRELLEKAIQTAIRRNENLRTRIIEIEQGDFIGPTQYISAPRHEMLDFVDFQSEEGKEQLEKWIEDNNEKPFNFIDDDLYYFALIKFNDREYGYYMKLHHIISDGGSTSFLINEIDDIFRQLKEGKSVKDDLNPSHIQYVSHEYQYLTSPQIVKDRKFWLQYLLPLPGEMTLALQPGDVSNVTGNSSKLAFSGDLRAKMHEYCKVRGTSLYKLILSALSLYIWRVTGMEEFVIGTVNHGRYKEIHKQLLGMFINFLPIKITIDSQMKFQDFVQKIGADINNIIKHHANYPSDLLSTDLRKIAGKDTKYFWNITLIGHPDKEKGNFHMEHISSNNEATPLTIHINCSNKDIDGILELEWVYQCEQFSPEDIMQIHLGLMDILADALETPGKKLAEVEFIPQKEYRWNQGQLSSIDFMEFEGNKIEPAEIEKVLAGHTDIKEVAVVIKAGENGDNHLGIYLVARKKLEKFQLEEYLVREYPFNRVPMVFAQLESMPVTPGGEVDRDLLQTLEIDISTSTHKAPVSETEKKFAQIWEQVLGKTSIGIDENFFLIGGDSIKLITVLSRINKEFNLELKVVDLYRNDTIEKLAQLLEKSGTPRMTDEYKETLQEIEDFKEEFLNEL